MQIYMAAASQCKTILHLPLYYFKLVPDKDKDKDKDKDLFI